MKRGLLVAALAALLSSGCFRTSVYSGLPPDRAALDNKWHSGLVGGWIETSGPYDLSQVCPHGWGELYVKTGFARALVHYFTLEIYSPQNVTIVCAAPAARGAAPAAGYAMPAAPPDSTAYPPPPDESALPPSPPPPAPVRGR